MIKQRYKRSRSTALTEINQHLAITLPHILWHGQDAGDIVVQEWILFLNPNTYFDYHKSITWQANWSLWGIGFTNRVPWRSILQDGSRYCQLQSSHRRGTAPHRSTVFCGPGRVWQAGTGFGNKSANGKCQCSQFKVVKFNQESWNIYLVLLSVHFKNRYSPLSVNLITRWMFPHTFGLITVEIRERCMCKCKKTS